MLNFLLDNANLLVPVLTSAVIFLGLWKLVKFSLKIIIPIVILWFLTTYGMMSSETIDLILTKFY